MISSEIFNSQYAFFAGLPAEYLQNEKRLPLTKGGMYLSGPDGSADSGRVHRNYFCARIINN
jgi:hypothetical protein